MLWKKGTLTLDNGATFYGMAPEWQNEPAFGEAVFTTGMVGYPESLTDPSFHGQILTFTYPLIGNYGIPSKDEWESMQIHPSAIITNQAIKKSSHYTSESSFFALLESKKIPLLTEVDTRELTKILRSRGPTMAALSYGKQAVRFAMPSQYFPVREVSPKKEQLYNSQYNKTLIVVDCGMKSSILNFLKTFPLAIRVVSHDYDYNNDNYDALFLSNGPGDPTACSVTIEILKKAMQNEKPILGICLGAQLLALASGASTYKLPFGHRGQNQPCINTATNRCYLTSQNHGYAIDESSLSNEWEVSFRNLNDGSVEGIAHKSLPYFAVQFHPEASPGPTDTHWIFNYFFKQLTKENALV